jgi:hypothetical protein
MSTQENAKALVVSTRSATDLWDDAQVLRPNRTEHRAAVASLLAWLIPDGALEHVDTAITTPDSVEGTVRVVAFTKSRIVVIDVVGTSKPTAVTASRSALRSLRGHDVPDVMLSAHSRLRFELDYGEALPGVGPVLLGNEGQTPRNLSDLQAFVPSLLADLER